MATKKKLLEAAAGAAGGGGGLNVEDVFSTYLYEGNSSTRNIQNGVDLTEGGLVWGKARTQSYKHTLFDTVRGANNAISSDRTTAEVTETGVTAFNSNGFTLGTWAGLNANGEDFASWTFRKAPRFFDCVTWTGTGSPRTISHNLGTTVGCMLVKRTSGTTNWRVYHRSNTSQPETEYLMLDMTSSTIDSSTVWNDTAPTDTEFTVGTSSTVNGSGETYVAYLFAHNDGDGDFGPTGDQDIIKCGSYTGNGSSTGPEIDLGFEPQWLMIKRTDASQTWWMMDIMRGFTSNYGGGTYDDPLDKFLRAQSNSAEESYNLVGPNSTGFQLESDDAAVNASGGTYIYIAIRRGPMAVPESATDVFDIATRDATHPSFDASFDTVDFSFVKNSATTGSWRVSSRLQGANVLYSDTTAAEASYSPIEWDHMDGWSYGVGTASTFYSWMWKRAPNYFDAVAYTGNGTAGRTVSHNLGVAPEMMWVKNRVDSVDWWVYHKDTGETKRLYLNQSYAALGNATAWNDTAPTDSVFTVGTSSQTNGSGDGMIAYLFASLDGVSKVGSYTGNGSNQNIDCGFSSGARFVIVKASSTSGQWAVWDTERGIVAGDDSTLYLDSTVAADTDLDFIDPYSGGFNITNNLGNYNASGVTYIFYAVA